MFRRNVTIKRKTGGYVDNDGYFHDGQVEEMTVLASVQPLNARDTEQYTHLYKEGGRLFSLLKLYTGEILYAEKQGGQEADILVYGGRLWKVVGVEEWQSNVINHFKVICQEIGEVENEE